MLKQGSGTLWEMTERAPVITLIGAGGKTTTLQVLVQEIQALGKPVIATTTTKVYPLSWAALWREPTVPPPLEKTPCFWYANEDSGEGEENKKWRGPDKRDIDQAILSMPGNICWVVEGDGARGRKLKCWDAHEPQIPSQTRCAVLLVAGDLWTKILSPDEIHRSGKCPALVGKQWSGETAAQYILSSPVFDPEMKEYYWIVLFNEYEESKTKLKTFSYYIKSMIADLEKYLYAAPEICKPQHLRIASGNVKEGRVEWYDLW